jgi:GT2 family glycosyltransferase
VHFLDDDDIVPAGHYAAVKQVFEANPCVGLVFGCIEPFGDCPAEQLERERRFFAAAAATARRCQRLRTRLGFVARTLFGQLMLVCSAGMVRRESVARVGGFNPAIRLMEDTDFFCRVMRADGVRFIDRVALHYRIGTPSLMHNPNPPASQLAEERESHRRFWANYRQLHGSAEFLALAAFSRTLLRLV